MGDWELVLSVLIGFIFSFVVAKLISLVVSFRDDKLKVMREEIFPINEPNRIVDESGYSSDKKSRVGEEDVNDAEKLGLLSESVLGEDDDDEDWEGIESTDLDETFSAATAFVAAAAADRLSTKVSNDVQLELYGFYKIATEGPCNISQPSALKMSARVKWNAWQRLGAMPTEEAMQKYIMIVNELYPSWATGPIVKKKDGDSDVTSSAAERTMGPVFSTFVYEEEPGNELKLEAIHACAREGEVDNLLKYIESSVSVNLKDSEGRTPLHWAVDRGHFDTVELLLSKNADVNAKDHEGQTPLHYATLCDREVIAKFLVKQNADTNVKDNDGNIPRDLCESNWPWMLS